MDHRKSSSDIGELLTSSLSTNVPTNPPCLKNGSSVENDDSGKGPSSTSSTDIELEDRKTCAKIARSDHEHVAVVSMSEKVVTSEQEESSETHSTPETEELPCHSRSSRPRSVPPSEPTASGSSGIKKRTTTSQSRNYRNSKFQTDPESSNDADFFSRKVARQHRSQGEVGESDSDDEEWGRPFKCMKEDIGNQEAGNDTQLPNAQADDTDTVDPEAETRTSSSHRSTPTSQMDYNDLVDIYGTLGEDSSRSGTESPLPPFRHVSSSSSSSSVIIENSESSSSSSDDYLEDLDERLSDTSRPLPDETNNSTTSTPEHGTSASSMSSTSPARKKPTKKVPKKILEMPKVLLKLKPKHAWNGPKELLTREMGLNARVQPQSAEIFRSKFYGCLFSAERLELMKKLDGHHGCVNCLNFNYSGTKLASGSDDLYIKIWDYAVGKCINSFQSGHKANVFQAKFVPFNGIDTVMVSCARDNQVRLSELDSTGKVCSSRKLAQHRGPAHKLSVNPENPQVILSCGEDGVVFNIDIREEKPERLVKVWENEKKIALFSIHQNPLASHEFCVTGKDQYVRIYDTRTLRTATVPVPGPESSSSDMSDDAIAGASASSGRPEYKPLKRFCPHHLVDSRTKTNVTAAVYNYNGTEILASYNDENIYLFDATHSDGADCTKVYEGHRNSATVKGVNFFGDRSQFIVSGSDCGNIYIWDKDTESIVNFFRGDENGVVNCLEGHPTAPILATSGLDDDIKIWIPSNEHSPRMSELATTVRKNLKGRQDDMKNTDMDSHIMWALWNHLRHTDRNRRRAGAEGSDSNESWWRDEDDDNDDDDDDALDFAARGVECSIV